MRIHITGMSPRMVSQRARERVTFAGSLEQALVEAGHDVYRGPDDANDTELVLGGVTSALSPGATYALVGLEQIGLALHDGIPLLLYADDPVLGKIRPAAQSAAREPDRLYSAYLMSKRVKQSRHLTQKQRRCVAIAIEMLADETWPPVLVPMHPWGNPVMAAKRLGVDTEVVPIDVSSQVELLTPTVARPPAMMWLTDQHYSAETLDPDRVSWPVVPIDSATMPSPNFVYGVARGVHQGAIHRMPGWWTPTPLYVAHARTVYLGDAEETRTIGVSTPYYLTPDDVESLSEDQHLDLAHDQAEHLKEVTWDNDTLSSRLTGLTGHASSFERRATKRPPPRT